MKLVLQQDHGEGPRLGVAAAVGFLREVLFGFQCDLAVKIGGRDPGWGLQFAWAPVGSKGPGPFSYWIEHHSGEAMATSK